MRTSLPENGKVGEAGPFQRLPSWLRVDTAMAALPEDGGMGERGRFQRLLPAWFQDYVRLMFALRSRFIWVGLVVQVLLGLFLLYLVTERTMPYLTGWWPTLIPVILGYGSVSGWFISRRIEVRWTEGGGSFSLPSLWRAFLLLIPVFLLRILLLLLYRWGIADTIPLQRMLLFFVPGMLTTRAVVMIIRMRRLQKVFVRQEKLNSPPGREVSDE